MSRFLRSGEYLDEFSALGATRSTEISVIGTKGASLAGGISKSIE
jgi:hypothetical protein